MMTHGRNSINHGIAFPEGQSEVCGGYFPTSTGMALRYYIEFGSLREHKCRIQRLPFRVIEIGTGYDPSKQ